MIITRTAFLILLHLFPSLCLFAQDHGAGHPEPYSKPAGIQGTTGVLLLAHGGKENWNEEVRKIAASVDRTMPVEVAFGMAAKRNIQSAADRLVRRGAKEIVAVPLFISSHSSVITSTEYLLGLRKEAPAAVAIFAKMNHGHVGHDSHESPDKTFDPTTPIKTSVPVRMTSALNRHPFVAEILLSRARAISRRPGSEVVVIVAHGPVSDEENNKWLADMGSLRDMLTARSDFKRIEYMTVRDDAPEPIRSNATADLRRLVERAGADGSRVLVVPLLLSYGGIEEGIRKRLEGLDYTMTEQALLPDERLTRWVLESVKGSK